MKTSRKKILIVSDFYNPHKSGIVTYIEQLVNTLKAKNYDITILTTKFSTNLDNIELSENIKIIRCKPTLKISRGFYSIDLVFKFIRIYRNFDLVNLHLPLVEIFPIIFFLKFTKTIVNYHCLPEFPLFLKFFKFYFYLFGFCSVFLSKKTLVLSKDYYDNILFHKLINKRVIEIPPFILLQNELKKRKNKEHTIRIGYLGRLSNEKGIEYLIEASKKLLINEVDHKITIAGDTEDIRFRKYINKIIKKSKFNNKINFIGKLNEVQKKDFFHNIDIFVLPSVNSFEAFGIVQLEAMSYGIPVIASNIAGVRTIIQKTKNGFLFNNKNSKDLYEKILLCNESKFDSNFIKNNTKIEYSREKFKNNVLASF